MPADSSALKYRALLEISEAFVACREYGALLETLWDSLHQLIRFDYLALVRYDEEKNARAWRRSPATSHPMFLCAPTFPSTAARWKC